MARTRVLVPPLLSIEEVAERLGVSTRYVRRLVAERRIAYLKVGRLLRFDTTAVDAWLEACQVRAYDGRTLTATTGASNSAVAASGARRVVERH